MSLDSELINEFFESTKNYRCNYFEILIKKYVKTEEKFDVIDINTLKFAKDRGYIRKIQEKPFGSVTQYSCKSGRNVIKVLKKQVTIYRKNKKEYVSEKKQPSSSDEEIQSVSSDEEIQSVSSDEEIHSVPPDEEYRASSKKKQLLQRNTIKYPIKLKEPKYSPSLEKEIQSMSSNRRTKIWQKTDGTKSLISKGNKYSLTTKGTVQLSSDEEIQHLSSVEKKQILKRTVKTQSLTSNGKKYSSPFDKEIPIVSSDGRKQTLQRVKKTLTSKGKKYSSADKEIQLVSSAKRKQILQSDKNPQTLTSKENQHSSLQDEKVHKYFETYDIKDCYVKLVKSDILLFDDKNIPSDAEKQEKGSKTYPHARSTSKHDLSAEPENKLHSKEKLHSSLISNSQKLKNVNYKDCYVKLAKPDILLFDNKNIPSDAEKQEKGSKTYPHVRYTSKHDLSAEPEKELHSKEKLHSSLISNSQKLKNVNYNKCDRLCENFKNKLNTVDKLKLEKNSIKTTCAEYIQIKAAFTPKNSQEINSDNNSMFMSGSIKPLPYFPVVSTVPSKLNPNKNEIVTSKTSFTARELPPSGMFCSGKIRGQKSINSDNFCAFLKGNTDTKVDLDSKKINLEFLKSINGAKLYPTIKLKNTVYATEEISSQINKNKSFSKKVLDILSSNYTQDKLCIKISNKVQRKSRTAVFEEEKHICVGNFSPKRGSKVIKPYDKNSFQTKTLPFPNPSFLPYLKDKEKKPLKQKSILLDALK